MMKCDTRENSIKVGIFSFFTGAGFLDLGFEDAGFKSYLANEIDSNFASVYRYSRQQMKRNLPVYGMKEGNVCEYLTKQSESKALRGMIEDARKSTSCIGFIGGPPCPDFSIGNANAKGEKGERGKLTKVYADLICAQAPDFFVLENVKGLLSTEKHRLFFNRMIKKLQESGYATTYRLINAMEYGVAQDRQRVILIGIKLALCKKHAEVKDGVITNFPWDRFTRYSADTVAECPWPVSDTFVEDGKRNMPEGLIRELTVQHWFELNDVEHHPNGMDYFTPRAGLSKMRLYDEGDDSKKCYKRVHRWRYSPTACYGNNEVHLHPYKARRLSVAETLAIQSLPKDFVLPNDISLSAKFKTIGNGVPYLLANGVAKTLMAFLEELLNG